MYRPKSGLVLLSSLLISAVVAAPVANAAEGTWENIEPPKEMTRVAHVASVNDKDAWLFGLDDADQNVAAHWDGTGWSPAELPKELRYVQDSAVRAPNDVWVTGTSTGDDSKALVLTHWDGQKWSIVDLPPDVRDAVRDMTFVGKDLWLAGGCCGYPAWLARFDGAQWSRFELPEVDKSDPYPMAVEAGADGSLYSGGFENTFTRSTADGATPLAAPQGSSEYTMVRGMASLDGGKTIWAGGVNYKDNDPMQPHPQLYRWDGGKWALDPYGADLTSSSFADMTRNADALFVLAEPDDVQGTAPSTVHRYDGSAWAEIAPLPFRAKQLSGTGDGQAVWAVEGTPREFGAKLALFRP